jgi:tripartite-type tricarboxylate transporter receptor subunit TctC
MKKTWVGVALMLAGLAGVSAGPHEAVAQAYPTKSISMIVPFGAGGGTDVLARVIADELSKSIGQPVVVEARPGANGAIGSGVVKAAAADGYTLLFTAQSTYSLNPNLMKELPYDQVADFVPITTVARSPWMLVVPIDSPFKTVADIVKAAKEKPETLTVGFWQSSVFVTSSVFEQAAGIKLRKVPYKGAVEAQTDVLAGRLSMLFTDTAGARGHIEGGKLRAIATTTAERSQIFTQVPTMKELGFPVITDSVLAVFAPAKTPKPVLDKLNAEFTKIIGSSPTAREKMTQLGMEPAPMSLADSDKFVRSELTRWGEMITKAGLQKE